MWDKLMDRCQCANSTKGGSTQGCPGYCEGSESDAGFLVGAQEQPPGTHKPLGTAGMLRTQGETERGQPAGHRRLKMYQS